jgi:ABC-type uncharacterized transport system substrate-binding protein
MSMISTRSLPRLLAGLVLLGGAAATGAEAHPHVWITVETVVIHDKGAFVGVTHKWTFDEYYTTMAVEGLDKNKDGIYDREELAELAKVNVEGLKDFGFFTFPSLAGQKLEFGEARDYWLEHKGGVLSLHFTLPFAQPVLVDAKGLTIAVTDPSYFIAFQFAKTDPVKLGEGAPKGCEAKLGVPSEKPGQGSALETLQTQVSPMSPGVGKAIMVECTAP